MKRSLVISILVIIMVMSFASSAFARGISPANRSSAFLDKGESYIAWDKAQDTMLLASESAVNTASVHGNYTTTTVKCQVCHSAHKAAAAGDTLLQSTASQACVPCHLGATASSDTKVSEGNRHGSSSGCTNGYCHSIAPHGAGDISKYATLAGAMLNDHADSLLDAAIASNAAGEAVEGNIYATGSDASDLASVITTIAIYNPNVTAALLNDTSSAAAISLGRAVGTGYLCANGGCHMNGAFNSLSDDATFGTWSSDLKFTSEHDIEDYQLDWFDDGVLQDLDPSNAADGLYPRGSTITTGGVDYDVWVENGYDTMRTEPIKGHTLAAVADLAVRDVAFANVGACMSCHDSVDYRISATAKQFPHGNDVVNSDGSILADESYAWFNVASYVGAADTTTTVDGTGVTSGSDGACLKCHRSSDTISGVGLTY